jgi:hypothetical protein
MMANRAKSLRRIVLICEAYWYTVDRDKLDIDPKQVQLLYTVAQALTDVKPNSGRTLQSTLQQSNKNP